MKANLRRGLLAALALVLFLPVQAQNRPDRAERLTQALDLTDAQTALVEDALSDAEPGTLWQLAADLTPTLTETQKEKLFTRPERRERGDRMRPRGDRRRSGDRMRDEDRAKQREAMMEKRAEHHEAMKAEMQEALGLTDAQVQQLDALHAERQAEREQRRADRDARRAERDDRGAELAEVLTPEQQEIAKVHRALAMRLHASRGHAGRHHRGHRR